MAQSIIPECDFEVEYTASGEVGLHERQSICTKNPRHRNFHPIHKLDINNLPEAYRTREVINAIKVIADLTVRIRSKYTSMKRPTTFPETEKAYTNSEHRGCSFTTVGTGFIRAVRIIRASDGRSSSCPCYDCKRSKKTACEAWGEVTVITAAHVICDADELVHAEVDCFYDSDEDMKTTVKTLYGNSMRASENAISKVSFADDFCQFSVITHEVDLCEQLSKHTMYDVITMDLGFEPSIKTSLAVIVSHPHGCPKCVSWGDSALCDTLNVEVPAKCRYRYNTPTCPGSSGALVWLLETLQNKWQKVYVHSASLRHRLNISGNVEVFGECISSDVPCHIS